MTTVTLENAEKDLAALIWRARTGEEIVIAEGKEPLAKLVPVDFAKERRRPGMMKGRLNLPDAFFFDPLPADELELWSGEAEDRE